MLATPRPVTSPFGHPTNRTADVVPIHPNDGDQQLSGSPSVFRPSRTRDELQAENRYLRRDSQERLSPGIIVGRSAAIQRVLEQARQVAATDSTVLLLGETGTGKELIATQIHEQSSRRGRGMVRINCAAIPSTLIESELFGREKGAFTGALARQIGRFELADHSTIFLDEIGDLPFDVQVKLLRVLEERQIERLGSPRAVNVNVRIIAATHRNLEAAHCRRCVPAGPVLPSQRLPDRRAAAARADRRHSPAGVALRRRVLEVVRQAHRRDFAGEHGGVAALSVAGKHPRAAQCRRARDDRGRRAQPDDRDTRPVAVVAEAQRQARWTSRGSTSSASSKACGWRIRGVDGAAERLGLRPTTLETRMAKLGIKRPRAG